MVNLKDSEENKAYYMTNTGYEDNRSRFNEVRVQWAARRAASAKRLLDVGCNDGFFAELLPESVEYAGIELNRKAVMHAYPRARGKIVEGDLLELYLRAERWDVIVCMEVLEHVVDPVEWLTKFRILLERDGQLITTSATGETAEHVPGNNEHLREWNPNEYRALHEAAGFEVVEQLVLEVYPGRYTNAVIAKKKGT